MLILTRRKDESIVITDGDGSAFIQVVVTNIDKNQVKLGINTPVDHKVWRNEIYERMLQNEK